jgi:cytoskeletal protein CcmA (bactofilin family)
LLVKGSCKIKEVSVATTCEIHGAVHAEKLTVKGDTIVNGSCKIEESTLNNVQWAGQELVLKDVELQNILIKKPSTNKAQKIILKGKTIIHGTITLEDKAAVIDAEESVVIKGGIKKGENHANQIKDTDKHNASNAGLWSQFKQWLSTLF